MNRILVVNINWLGDSIFASPVFKALKEAYPQARICCLSVPRVREILESIPSIDEVIVYDEKGAHRSPLAKLRLIFDLRRQRFDAAFLLHRSLTRALFVFLAGIPRRIGYDTKGRGIFLTHRISETGENRHRSDHYLNVIESFGVPVKDRRSFLCVDPQAKRELEAILNGAWTRENAFRVVVHTGGNWDLKRWPAANFTRLIRRLQEEAGTKVVVAGSGADVPLVGRIVAPLKEKPINLAGRTTLKQLLALMETADAVISADSGPLHIASSVGSSGVGIFGPTRPEITGPRGTGEAVVLQHDVGCNRQPCYYLKCPDNICMQSVTVEEVMDVIRKIRNP